MNEEFRKRVNRELSKKKIITRTHKLTQIDVLYNTHQVSRIVIGHSFKTVKRFCSLRFAAIAPIIKRLRDERRTSRRGSRNNTHLLRPRQKAVLLTKTKY